MGDYLFISDAAKEVKVESHVLRYWEEELHLPIKRNELGHRYYTEEDVERFKQIKSMKERGLQLKAIKMILRDGKLDVLSMEETGIDRTTRRNQAEPDPEAEFSDAGIEDSAIYQPQSPMSEIEMDRNEIMPDRRTGRSSMPEERNPPDDMPEGRNVQSRMPQGGMAEGRNVQPRMGSMPERRNVQPRTGSMPEGRNVQPRMGSMPEGRNVQSRMGDMPEGRNPQLRMPQNGMPQIRNSEAVNLPSGMARGRNAGARMSEESGELAIDIISAKDKEPVIQESREDKSRRLQWLLQQLIRQTLQENNIELCREIRDSVVKELDYQFRMQEEREDARDRMMEERSEEHYRKMDELIRKKSRRLRKMKPDKEQHRELQDRKGSKDNKAVESDEKEWEMEGQDGRNSDIEELDKWNKDTGETNQNAGETKEREKRGWNRGEKSKWKQGADNQNNTLQEEQSAPLVKKKRRFF